MATVFAVGTTPSMEHPNAVEQPATTGTLRGCAFSQSMISFIIAMDWAGARFRLARECPSLTDTGMLILCTPAWYAFCTPRRLGASACTVMPGTLCSTRATTSGVSARWGMTRAGTKLPTSISFTPAAAIAAIQPSFVAVGIRLLAICNPSRGPTSQMETNSLIVREPLRST
jgi:hypothetical protein